MNTNHPANLYLSKQALFLQRIYRIVEEITRLPKDKLSFQEICFDQTFTKEQILPAVYQDLRFWHSDQSHSPAEIFLKKQRSIMERLFPEECKQVPLENINLEWLLMEFIGYETGDYSLKPHEYAIFQRQQPG